MKTVHLPSRETLQDRLEYNPITGELVWRKSGKVAGCKSHGYIVIRIDGTLYRAHRLIWKMMTGEEPDIVDHKNRVRDDNRWSNLFNGTSTDNNHNLPLLSSNKSGVKGVSWDSNRGKWAACISVNNKTIHLGRFDSLTDAAIARKNGEEKYWR